jgi:hypothetical protein
MEYPTGRKLESPPAKGHVGTMTYGVEASEGNVKFAARQWPERKLEEFDVADREWRDLETGEVYKVVRGNPLLGDQAAADCFVVASGLLWFLKTTAPARQVVLGSVVAS